MNHHEQRIKALQQALIHNGLGSALLFYSRDIFYYTGVAQPAFLAVFPDDYILCIKSGYEYALKNCRINKNRVVAERRLENIYHEYFSYRWNKVSATELDLLPAKQFMQYQETFEGFEFRDISPMILRQRAVKEPYEVEQIRKACAVVEAGQQAVFEKLRPGMTELELAAEIEYAHRLQGHEGDAFLRLPDLSIGMGPIGSGPSLREMTGVIYSITGVGLSPSLPIGPSNRVIEAGDPIVVDIPSLVNGYHADQSRTYVAGKASKKIKGMYSDLKEISDYLIEHIRPGMSCGDAYAMAIKQSQAMNVSNHFLNFSNGHKSSLIGHGVGIEVNEPPVIIANNKAEIPHNSVLAIEIHMLDPSAGVVKIEDTVLISDQGNEILTKGSRELFESGLS